MSTRALYVWAVVHLLPKLQNAVVSRFRRRSEAEECLHLLRRSNPNNRYEVLYAPPDKDLEKLMAVISNDWLMYGDEGNAAVSRAMQEIYRALSKQPLPAVRSLLKQKVQEVAATHPEVYATDVREAIATQLTTWACQVHDLSPDRILSVDYWDL
jgi:hypothetical protein